jgi:DNA helicase IV
MLFEQTQAHVLRVVEKIQASFVMTKENVKNIKARLKRTSGGDRMMEAEVLKYSEQRVGELEQLQSSPYFVGCEIEFAGKAREEIYFSKFSFSEEQIYSWTTSASRIRYEEPGEVSYELPDGTIRHGKMLRKNQFMIVGGKIIFMASEALGSARQLIYQKHLMQRKNTFFLPEIVEQMEKKQDEVIRADYHGSYLISGPAGSGKTTLALHRVAYLAQSPDTAEHFPSANIIVFVHDNSTKEYFSNLLPQLGINNVTITIFSDWAREILGLGNYQYIYRHGESEAEKDQYEFLKNKAPKDLQEIITSPAGLLKVYSSYFSADLLDKFRQQLEQKKLDRFDLTILLQSFINQHGGLKKQEIYIAVDKNGREKIKRGLLPVEYSLIVIDEAENYLSEQIALIKNCANKNQAVLYVGDLAQQTKLCTIKNWQEVGEDFIGNRKVELFKVYRNTKEILEYVRVQGYDVTIPAEIKTGKAVVEKIINSPVDEADYIEELINGNKDLIIGLIHRDLNYLIGYKEKYQNNSKMHVLSIDEAQGVEFDVVIFLNYEHVLDFANCEAELISEKKRVQRDLNYVAMTRAMSELYVLKYDI